MTIARLLKKYIEKENKNFDLLFLRNHVILKEFTTLKDKSYLSKTILYGLDVHLEYIKKLENKFLSIITQSDILKQKYIDAGVSKNKIVIQEPFAYKYNFNFDSAVVYLKKSDDFVPKTIPTYYSQIMDPKTWLVFPWE